MAQPMEFHALMVGPAGAGKSSLGNALVDDGLFPDTFGCSTDNKCFIDHHHKSINGVEVHGYDTMGYFDGEVEDEEIIAAIKAIECDLDIVIVCIKFCDRFGRNAKCMFDVLNKLSIPNIWEKVVVALTHADIIPPRWSKQGPDVINEEYQKAYGDWKNRIYSHLATYQDITDEIPIVPTSHIEANPQHGNLQDKLWLQKLLYTVASRSHRSPEVVLSLACAVRPEQFLAMLANDKGIKIPQTNEEQLELLAHIFGGENIEKLLRLLLTYIEQEVEQEHEQEVEQEHEQEVEQEREQERSGQRNENLNPEGIMHKLKDMLKRHKIKLTIAGGLPTFVLVGAGCGVGVGAGVGMLVGAPTCGLGLPVLMGIGAVGGAAVGGVTFIVIAVTLFCLREYKKHNEVPA